MPSLSYYPLKCDTYLTAKETAKEESILHPNFFIYLLKNNSGMYLIDYIGIKHDDEHIIATFKNGDKTL